MGESNHVVLRGRLVELDVLRHTPAGVPVRRFRIGHASKQREGGVERETGCEVACVAVDREARLLSGAMPGSTLVVTGFLDRKGRSVHRLELHATQIEFEKGI